MTASRPRTGREAHVTAPAFRDDAEIVVADMRGVLSSWRTDGSLLRTWQSHRGAVKSLVVSGDRAVTSRRPARTRA